VLTIVAGTGYTGQRVLERLPSDATVGLSRSHIDTLWPSHIVDFDTMEALPVNLPQEYAVLYTCPPSDENDERLQRFLSLLTPVPTRFVYISTTGVYGDRQGAVVTEETPPNPSSKLSRMRVGAEQLLASGAVNSGCDLVILRSPAIYGPGRSGVNRVRKGRALIREEEASPGNRIHVDDLASCCIAALAETTLTGIYNVGDGDHRSSTWFADEVARQAGLPEPRKISRAQAINEFSPARLAFASSSRIVDTTKMQENLGVELAYADPAKGIAASL